MAAPPPTDPIKHRATCGWPTRSANGNVALRGVSPTELPEATTLALDRMCLLMETLMSVYLTQIGFHRVCATHRLLSMLSNI